MQHVSLMGILNITPDSFSDGGTYFENIPAAVKRAERMLREGADIIDVGGESTRPGSDSVSTEEELRRIIPVITAIRASLGSPFPISVDTNKADVARKALQVGATMINSLGGFASDPLLADVVAQSRCQVCIYHIKGTPRTMQQTTSVDTDIIQEITQFFDIQITLGVGRGMTRDQFILDPGIGFGKTLEQNLEIIKRLDEFGHFRLPILIGVSRKSHLGEILRMKLALRMSPSPKSRKEAALAETVIALQRGATIIRTHDVKETKRFITLLEELI